MTQFFGQKLQSEIMAENIMNARNIVRDITSNHNINDNMIYVMIEILALNLEAFHNGKLIAEFVKNLRPDTFLLDLEEKNVEDKIKILTGDE